MATFNITFNRGLQIFLITWSKIINKNYNLDCFEDMSNKHSN